MTHSIEKISILKYNDNQIQSFEDSISIEEPLEISIVYVIEGKKIKKNISITMRTPGHDDALACGFLFTEGIIENYAAIEKISHLSPNEITVFLNESEKIDLSKIERHFYTSSSCGVCGKSSIDSIRTIKHLPKNLSPLTVSSQIILQLEQKVKKEQAIFESTGGLHASALFNISGEFISLFEDVGRHNALDKLIGHSLINHLMPLHHHILFLSGRASFELIQKAAMAEIQIVCALGAPSSLAVSLAKEFNITLIGFLKSESFNIYHDNNRII